MNKKKELIVFIRHAHRDKPIPDADNGLSDKGQKQVEDLLKDFRKGKFPQGKIFWSSPKLRCQETLGPLANANNSKMVVENLLNEQESGESQHQFLTRIEELLDKASALNETIYLCSHGDFIPVAIDLMTGKSIEVKKGQGIILSFEKNKWEIL